MEATAKQPPLTKPTVTFGSLKAGDVLSETQYYVVDRVDSKTAHLINDAGEEISVSKNYVESCLDSAGEYQETRIVSRTEAIQAFLSHPYTAMTVNFNKKIEDKLLINTIVEAHENSSPKEFKNTVSTCIKNALVGEERTMVGRHFGHQDEFGRINFVDMQLVNNPEKDYDTRIRLVDPRTINWLIVKGIKYQVKLK